MRDEAGRFGLFLKKRYLAAKITPQFGGISWGFHASNEKNNKNPLTNQYQP